MVGPKRHRRHGHRHSRRHVRHASSVRTVSPTGDQLPPLEGSWLSTLVRSDAQ